MVRFVVVLLVLKIPFLMVSDYKCKRRNDSGLNKQGLNLPQQKLSSWQNDQYLAMRKLDSMTEWEALALSSHESETFSSINCCMYCMFLDPVCEV